MIGIKSGGYFFDVYKDTRISVELNNPLFSDDNLSKGSGAFPFDLPGGEESPGNAVRLGQPDVLENTQGFKKLDAELLFDGLPFRRGRMEVEGHTGNKTTATFNFGLGAIGEDFKTKKVRELIAEEIVIDDAAITKKIYLKPGALATAPYSITVNGRVYEANTLANLAAAINADTAEPRASAAVINTGTTPLGVAFPFMEITPYSGATDPLTPLHVDYAEDNGNSYSGYVWYVEAFDMTAYNSAFSDFMDSYNESPYPHAAIRFPVMFNDSFAGQAALQSYYFGFAEGAVKSTNYVNARNSFGLVFNTPNYTANGWKPLNRNSIAPVLRVKYVLDKMAEYFGFAWEGNWFDADADAMLLETSVALDAPMDFIGKTKFLFWRRSFNLNELVEDLTCVDFLKLLTSRYNLAIYRNDTTGGVAITKRETVALKNTDTDITARAGRVKEIRDMRQDGVRLITPKNEADSYSTADEYNVGDPESSVEVKLAALQNEYTTTINGGAGNVTGILKQQPFSDEFKMRIIYYKGLINNGTFTYPQARKDAINYTEAWSGAGGLYERRWKYWIWFAMRRRLVMVPVSFEFDQLQKMSWEDLFRLDRNRFLVKRITAELTPDGLSVSEVEFYSMI